MRPSDAFVTILKEYVSLFLHLLLIDFIFVIGSGMAEMTEEGGFTEAILLEGNTLDGGEML